MAMSKPNTANGTPGGGGGGGGEVVPIEPSENEPCMGTPMDEKENFFVRFRDNICKKYQLTYLVFYFIVVVLVLLVILLVIIIALGASWPHIPHSRQYGVCKKAGCLRAAAQIHEFMNDSISPCTDLWTFTCGQFLTQSFPKDRGSWNQKQQLIKQEATRIRDLVTTLKLPLHTASVEWKLKHLYDACLDVDNVNTDGSRPLRSIITELGGWYILRDWNNADFNAKDLLRQLHVKHRVTPFFKISVEPDPLSPGSSRIRISPSGLGLPDRNYYFLEDDEILNAYKELIRDVVINLSTTTNEAEKFGNDIFYYEKRIAEITPNTENLQNPISTCTHIKISELKETIINIPFFDILTATYPESDVNENTEVIVTSLEYLTEMSQIFASTDKKTMNGYLIWTLVREYLPYLPEKFTSVVDRFNRKLYGIQEPLERWEFCAYVTKNFVSLAINVMYDKSMPINQPTKAIINEMFKNIVNVASRRINKYQSTKSSQLHNHLKRKLLNLSLQIGLPENVLTDQYLKNYYTKLRIMKADLFESIKYSVDFKKKIEEKILIKTSPEDGIIKVIEAEKPKVTYLPENNTLVIPSILLRAPFFEDTYPKSIIYGRLGVEIAEAVSSAILPYDNFWTSERKLLSPYHLTVNDSLKSIDNVRQCLRQYFQQNDLKAASESEIVILKQLSGISIAFEALTDALASDEHVHQPALEEFEDSSVFFLTYAQTQCSRSTSQFQLYETTVKFQLPQESLLNLAWKQLPHFSEAFDCPFDSKYQCRDLL